MGCATAEGLSLRICASSLPEPAPCLLPPDLTPAPANYEAALAELELLLVRLESGDLPLAQLLSAYQRGAELLKYCRERLEAVEGQIKVLDQGALKTWAPE